MKKTVLITGASGGIGSALSCAFAEDGWQVALHYHKNEYAAKTLRFKLTEKGMNAEIFNADLSSFDECESLCGAVIKKFGRIDALVNNAGVSRNALFTDITSSELNEVFAVNFFGAFYVTQNVVKNMLKRKSGTIINISSIWGKSGAACESHYAASKAALDGLTKSLAKELGLSGITANAISCGMIDTAMNETLSDEEKKAFTGALPVPRMGSAAEVAKLAVYLASDAAKYITGQVISLDGGFSI